MVGHGGYSARTGTVTPGRTYYGLNGDIDIKVTGDVAVVAGTLTTNNPNYRDDGRLSAQIGHGGYDADATNDNTYYFGATGNAAIPAAERLARTRAHYLPFHAALADLLACRLAQGLNPVLITVHSFTPVYFGQPRAVEFGLIHDADDRLARAICAQETGLLTRLNEPYSAADGVPSSRYSTAPPPGTPEASRVTLTHGPANWPGR